MPTPKLNPTVIAQVREQLAAFVQEFTDGGYSPSVQERHRKYADDFGLFLEGRFSPAAEKGKLRH
jgi:hypothetical protein